jgi:hypothetical protein
VPEKAMVPFMVNAFDYVTFIHRLTRDLPGICFIIIDFDDDESSD